MVVRTPNRVEQIIRVASNPHSHVSVVTVYNSSSSRRNSPDITLLEISPPVLDGNTLSAWIGLDNLHLWDGQGHWQTIKVLSQGNTGEIE